jgi:hypothetical protein
MKFLLIIHFKNVLKNCLNLYTRNFKGGEAMNKLIQTQQETQQETQKGGEAMNKTQTQQETQIYFITFPSKLPTQKAKEIVTELRKRFPSQIGMFTPKPPRGRRTLIDIGGVLVIITFPYTPKKEAPQSPKEGFSLKELIKKT